MIPKKRERVGGFEKVKVGEFIYGIIERIEYDEQHIFKFQGEEKEPTEAVRFVFKLDGYEYPKRSRWMRFSTSERSNLYQKYITKLILDAHPDMLFNFESFKAMKIKTIWSESGDYQNLESIFPNDEKLEVKEAEQ